MDRLTIASTVTLRDGNAMPRFGLGTYRESPQQAEDSVRYAMSLGYRLVDTASLYHNEDGVAEGIKLAGFSRDDVFVTTKVWNMEQGYEQTIDALDRSLEMLGMDHVDLYLVHWPIQRLLEPTWRAMEELFGAGKAKSIGVCNFLEHHLDALLQIAEVMPAVDQFEFHPRLQQPSLQRFCAQNDIVVQAWAPVMRGQVMLVPELVSIAQAHDKTPAQVSLRWILQLGHTLAVKSAHNGRVRENSEIFDFELSAEEMEIISGLDAGERIGPDPDSMAWES